MSTERRGGSVGAGLGAVVGAVGLRTDVVLLCVLRRGGYGCGLGVERYSCREIQKPWGERKDLARSAGSTRERHKDSALSNTMPMTPPCTRCLLQVLGGPDSRAKRMLSGGHQRLALIANAASAAIQPAASTGALLSSRPQVRDGSSSFSARRERENAVGWTALPLEPDHGPRPASRLAVP